MRAPTPDIADCLAALPLFHEMHTAELGRLAASSLIRPIDRGDVIFRVGDPCEGFHVVLDGQVKLFALSHAGQEKVIELVRPGQTFAESLMFTGNPYMVHAQALCDGAILTIRKQAVLDEIAHDGRFALRMLAGIARRMDGLVQDVEASALHSGIQRVVSYLLREQAEHGQPTGRAPRVSLPVSKATIASLLSLTPEYFSRVLRELEERGYIAMDRRDIRILDPQALAAYQMQ